jgi:FAD/FMN-containing dehydrogenase
VIVGVDPDPAKKECITTWAQEYWDALHPYSAGGAYINFMMNEGENQVKASYRDNYDRLAAVKAKFDPTNLFRVNQNIRPSS